VLEAREIQIWNLICMAFLGRRRVGVDPTEQQR
jgi:hypothetical protein